MFSKVNLNLGEIDINKIKGSAMQKYGPKDSKLIHFQILDWEYFMGLHKDRVRFNIMPVTAWYTEIEGTGPIPPHIDPVDKLALNYYIETGECTTRFYEVKKETNVDFSSSREEFNEQDSTKTVKSVLDPSQLTCLGEFTASAGDAFLIRTDILHSVSTPKSVRKFISYRWIDPQFTFEQIAQSIQIL